MIATSPDRSYLSGRLRNPTRLGVGLLLLTLPACGLSDYEARMRETQERDQRFRDENKYLDEPVKIPTRKEKDREVPLADVFFRPPKGIQSAFQAEPRGGLLWRYPAGRSSNFLLVEMAFAEKEKDFAADVLRNYQATEQTKPRTQQFSVPRREPLTFDTWDFDDAQYGYSVNVLRGSRTPVAIVYVFGKGRRDSVRKVMDLSLQTLAVDQQANAARQKYQQKSPWRLRPAPAAR